MEKDRLVEDLRTLMVDIEVEHINSMTEDEVIECFTHCPECGTDVPEELISKIVEDSCCLDKFLELIEEFPHDEPDSEESNVVAFKKHLN